MALGWELGQGGPGEAALAVVPVVLPLPEDGCSEWWHRGGDAEDRHHTSTPCNPRVSRELHNSSQNCWPSLGAMSTPGTHRSRHSRTPAGLMSVAAIRTLSYVASNQAHGDRAVPTGRASASGSSLSGSWQIRLTSLSDAWRPPTAAT